MRAASIPAASNRLDDLCARYAIDNSRRTKHGALLDAELLAEVYVELIGARQAQLVLSQAVLPGRALGEPIIVRERPVPLPPRVTADERAAHRHFIATLGDNAIWRDYSARLSGCDGGAAVLRHPLAVESDEIDRIEQERREAAVAHRRGDDLARKWKQKRGHSISTTGCMLSGGTFWMRKMPAKTSSKLNSSVPCDFGLAFQPQRQPRSRSRSSGCIDVDLDVDASAAGRPWG